MRKKIIRKIFSFFAVAILIGCTGCGFRNDIQDKHEYQGNQEDERIIVDDTRLSAGICEIKDDCEAMMTIISDDGDYETAKELNALFAEYKMKGTVAGVVTNVASYEEEWKQLLDEGNIELISHSYSHRKVNDETEQTKDDLIHEYVDALDYYKSNMNISMYCMIYPNNSTVDDGYNICRENGIVAIRQGERGYNSLRPIDGNAPGEWLNLRTYGIGDVSTTEERNGWIDSAIAENKWLIEMWHNVTVGGGDTYQEISTEQASAHLAYAYAKSALYTKPQLWIADFSDAVAYLKLKEMYTVKAWHGADRITVQITPTVDDLSERKLFHEKLTMFVVLPEEITDLTISEDMKDLDYRIVQVGDERLLYFDIEPEEKTFAFFKKSNAE